MAELSGRVILITGASRGIGRAVAAAAGRLGAHCILVARTVGGLEEADDEVKAAGGSTTLVPLDLKDFDALDRLGASIYERWGKLDGFVANAGVLGTLTPLHHLEPKAFKELLDVNITANWRLIRSLDPLLRLSDAGRAVFISSGMAHRNEPFWGGYAMSKVALESLVQTYAAENTGSKMKINIYNPGIQATAMLSKAMPGYDWKTLPPLSQVGEDIAKLLLPSVAQHGSVFTFSRK
jgi:NAD(P)-dependent dehydrogenase (short-subunit alcohol dehydrogenase family)